jgi:hypothetical protein
MIDHMKKILPQIALGTFFLLAPLSASALLFTCVNNCTPSYGSYEGTVRIELQCNATSPESFTAQLSMNGKSTPLHTRYCRSDLIVDAPVVLPVTAGIPVFLAATVRNVGESSTRMGFSNFFQVANAAAGGGGIIDLAATAMPTLGNSLANIASSPSYAFPGPGTYSVRACADKSGSASPGVVTEMNDGNNCSGWTNVSVTCPLGTAWTGGSCQMVAFSCTGAVPVNAAAYDVEESFGLLANTPWTHAGADGASKCEYRCNAGYLWNGVSCTALVPDLIMASIDPTASPTAGTPTTFSASVQNVGNAATGAGFNNFFRIANASNGGGIVIALPATPMGALVQSASDTATSPQYTFTVAGTYSIRACTDQSAVGDPGVIGESNEGNNCGPWTDVTVLPGPKIEVTPPQQEFPDTVVGEVSNRIISVRNIGGGILIGSIGDLSPFFCVSASCAFSLTSVDAPKNFILQFEPGAKEPYSAEMPITSNDVNLNYLVWGRGILPIAGAAELDFGTVVTDRTKTMTFTVENVSDSPIACSGAGLNVAPFSCSGVNCGLHSLSANSSELYTVVFAPKQEDSFVETSVMCAGVNYSILLKGSGVRQRFQTEER